MSLALTTAAANATPAAPEEDGRARRVTLAVSPGKPCDAKGARALRAWLQSTSGTSRATATCRGSTLVVTASCRRGAASPCTAATRGMETAVERQAGLPGDVLYSPCHAGVQHMCDAYYAATGFQVRLRHTRLVDCIALRSTGQSPLPFAILVTIRLRAKSRLIGQQQSARPPHVQEHSCRCRGSQRCPSFVGRACRGRGVKAPLAAARPGRATRRTGSVRACRARAPRDLRSDARGLLHVAAPCNPLTGRCLSGPCLLPAAPRAASRATSAATRASRPAQ